MLRVVPSPINYFFDSNYLSKYKIAHDTNEYPDDKTDIDSLSHVEKEEDNNVTITKKPKEIDNYPFELALLYDNRNIFIINRILYFFISKSVLF